MAACTLRHASTSASRSGARRSDDVERTASPGRSPPSVARAQSARATASSTVGTDSATTPSPSATPAISGAGIARGEVRRARHEETGIGHVERLQHLDRITAAEHSDHHDERPAERELLGQRRGTRPCTVDVVRGVEHHASVAVDDLEPARHPHRGERLRHDVARRAPDRRTPRRRRGRSPHCRPGARRAAGGARRPSSPDGVRSRTSRPPTASVDESQSKSSPRTQVSAASVAAKIARSSGLGLAEHERRSQA